MSCPLDAIEFWRSPAFHGATCACGWVAQYYLRSEVDTAVVRHIEGRLPEGLEALPSDGDRPERRTHTVMLMDEDGNEYEHKSSHICSPDCPRYSDGDVPDGA